MRLDDTVAAVDAELGTRDEFGGVTGKEDDSALEVLRITHL